jgi:hypothetical protein
LPKVLLLAGSIVSYVAATSGAIPTGFWDLRPGPTAGRVRRVFSRVEFSQLHPLSGRIREKASVTGHLRTGVAAHRRQKRDEIAIPPLPLAA